METCNAGAFLCWLLSKDPIIDLATIILAGATYRLFRATLEVSKQTNELAKQTAELAKNTVAGNQLADLHHRQALQPNVVPYAISYSLKRVMAENELYYELAFTASFQNIGPGPAAMCTAIVWPRRPDGQQGFRPINLVDEPMAPGESLTNRTTDESYRIQAVSSLGTMFPEVLVLEITVSDIFGATVDYEPVPLMLQPEFPTA